MDNTKTSWWIRPLVAVVRNHGINACERKAMQLANGFTGKTVNIGGGRNRRWPDAECIDAMHSPDMDFNTKPLPIQDESVDLVVCEQVIEHLHNTTFFLGELNRMLKPGGRILLSTENLASLPNLFAIILQKAPFSTQSVCGSFIGGWKTGPAGDISVSKSHPTYSGVTGHVRVMTVGQIKSLLGSHGFRIKGKYGYAGNHYVLFDAVKLAT